MNGLLKQLIKVVFSNSAVDMTSNETIGSFVGHCLGDISMVIICSLYTQGVIPCKCVSVLVLYFKVSKGTDGL